MLFQNSQTLLAANHSFLQDVFGIQLEPQLIRSISSNLDISKANESIDFCKGCIHSLPKVSFPLPALQPNSSIKFDNYKFSDFHEKTSSQFEANFRNYSIAKLIQEHPSLLDNFSSVTPRTQSLLVIGIRTPFFLDLLLKWSINNGIKYLAFVDHGIDSLLDSCACVDWPSISNLLKQHGIKSSFFLEKKLHHSLANAVSWLSSNSYYSAVHFYYYIDKIYNDHCIDAVSMLSDPSSFYMFTAKGFFEDNLNMVYNTFSTYSSHCCNYLDLSNSYSIERPLLLIASGPSLQDTIDEIKTLKNEYNAFIVACGSAITCLFDNNIIPDFVVLVERNASVYYKHRDESRYHKFFSQVNLVAASTVDSRIFPFYKSVSIYTRSSNIFRNDTQSENLLFSTHTTSANAALSFSLCLKPSHLVFYGLDFGSSNRSFTRHPSAHGIGSYKLDCAVKGQYKTIFSNRSLMRSHDLFKICLVSKTDKPKMYNRSLAYFHPDVHSSTFDDILALFQLHSHSSDYVELPYLMDKPFNQYPFDYSSMLSFIDDSTRHFAPNVGTCPVTSLGLSLINNFSTDACFKLISPLIKSNLLVFSALYASIIDDIDPQIRPSVQQSFFNSFAFSIVDLLSISKDITSQIHLASSQQ